MLAADAPPPDGDVDENTLTSEQRQKLRVLRRITGGRVSDVELLARIEADGAADMASPAADKDKRKKGRWWSG